MTFLKLLLNGGLIFIATMAQPSKKNLDNTSFLTTDYINHRLPSAIVPIHYNIMLKPLFDLYGYLYLGGGNHEIIDVLEKHELRRINKRNETDHQVYFYGQSNITINILRTTKQLVLHSLNLYIDEEETILIPKENTTYKPMKYLYSIVNNTVTLYFKEELHSGYYNLSMKFVGSVVTNNNKGLIIMPYKNMSGNHKLLIITHLQPISARRVFPCWDEPALRATFNISIKHSSFYLPLSNTPKMISEGIIESEGEMIRTYFETTSKIPAYLVAFTLINMTNNINNSIITVGKQIENLWWTRICDQLSFAKLVTKNVMAFLNDHWKEYVKFSKLEHIVIPEALTEPVSLNNIMDNWGMIIYRESDIIETESDSVMTKIRIERFIAYKMTRHLLGNLVSPSWWSHVWLNDALAHFFGVNAISQIYPKRRIMDLFVVQDLHESLRLDYEGIMMPLEMRNSEVHNSSEIEYLFSSIHYAFTLKYKGPALIFMLQHMIGHEILQEGIRRYFDKYCISSATPDDLWDTIQMVLDKSNKKNVLFYKYKFSKLKNIMNSWIYKISYPMLDVKQNSYGHEVIEVMYPTSILRIQNMWKIPLTYSTQTNINFDDTLPETWIDHLHLISLDNKTDWIIINLQHAGYYRVNYYSDNWWKIANFLNSDDYTKIHILNRAQIIDDAYHFLTLGKLELPIFLELTKYLSQETDYIAWYPMFRIFEFISNIIPFKRKYAIIIKIHMRNILHGLLNEIEYDEQLGEDELTKCLRKEAKKWACIFGDFECFKYAATALESYLEDYEQITHLPMPQCNTWENYKSLLRSNVDPDVILDYIKLLLPDNVHFMYQIERENWDDTFENLYVIIKHVRNKRVLEYLLNNFHNLEILPNQLDMKKKIAILIIIMNHVYNGFHLDMISKKLLELIPNEEIIWMFRDKILDRLSHYVIIWANTKYLQYRS